MQWIGQGFVDVPLFGSLAASMTDVFAHVQVFRPVPAALVFVASDAPLDLIESGPRALAAAPEDFARAGIHRVEDLLASLSLDEEGVRLIAQGRPLNTDDHNLLATTRLPPRLRDENTKTSVGQKERNILDIVTFSKLVYPEICTFPLIEFLLTPFTPSYCLLQFRMSTCQHSSSEWVETEGEEKSSCEKLWAVLAVLLVLAVCQNTPLGINIRANMPKTRCSDHPGLGAYRTPK